MGRTSDPAVQLAERLCRRQRVGVFGHRGVGKTTLLAMLYREAVGGRLPGLRLAAADARTAEYLSDKVLQLESGQTLPGTLAETDLSFNLYRDRVCLELLLKDYQGEHVEVGRVEPIGDFLRDCDAVWLCLDTAGIPDSADRLRRQQEVEQLLEHYLTNEPFPVPSVTTGATLRSLGRPFALVLTKADLLGPEAADLQQLAGTHFDMVRHALQAHCPDNGLFAVSSLGPRSLAQTETPLQPRNLAEPLTWLVSALQAQDEARLARIWSLAGNNLPLLQRCVACFARRYPEAPQAAEYRRRLRALRRGRLQRRVLVSLAACTGLVLGTGAYDALAYRSVRHFEQTHAAEPAAVVRHWETYQTWHPSRNLWRSGAAEAETAHLGDLRQQVHQQQCQAALAELRHRSADPDADAEELWHQFQTFHFNYPEVDVEGELRQLRAVLKTRRDAQLAERAQRAFDELVAGEQQETDLLALVSQADRFLRDYSGTPQETEVRRRRDAYLARLDDRDIEFARNYSARQPLNFQTRLESYQHYLDRHPDGSASDEARGALRAIEADWDRHDFRELRDLFVSRPGDVTELVARCRTYLAVHPHGRFKGSAEELLRWSERVTAPGEYHVVLRSGHFDHKVARWFSRGPNLSVEIEVAGARYGPSNIVTRSYDPDWEYEFPRPIRWKLGDPVRIRVTDNYWGPRVVTEIASEEGDPLAIRLLGGEDWSSENRVTFESDFAMPTLPKIE